MDPIEIREIIRRELLAIVQEDTELQQLIRQLASDQFADKVETESRFDRLLAELRREREAQNKKWAENQAALRLYQDEQNKKWAENQAALRLYQDEQNKRFDEQNKKWAENQAALRLYQDEQNKKWAENQEAIRQLIRKYDSTIGALGARWGLHSEQSFRNALKGILEESFGVEVQNITEFDDEGYVFGSPDQVELDLIIKNGSLIICEIKSSMSRSDMYTFNRKVAFYEQRHQVKAARKLVISPMVDKYAQGVAAKLAIEVYSHAEDVEASSS